MLVSQCCYSRNLVAQNTCINLQFWRTEFQNRSHWAKIKTPAGLYFFLKPLRKNPFSCLFLPAFFGSCPSSVFKAANSQWSCLQIASLWPPLPHLRVLEILEPTSTSPYFKVSCVCNLDSPLLHNIRYSWILGISMWPPLVDGHRFFLLWVPNVH